jgi:hypothetical protein
MRQASVQTDVFKHLGSLVEKIGVYDKLVKGG